MSGSPVIDSGTLRLNWNTAPTSSNVPNAIVKRDASGSFSAGSIVGNAGLTGRSSSGVAVWGESTGPSAGADGVHGVAHGPASGVAGVNTSVSGVGVWGQSPGWSFFANGDVHQERTGGGWVKAIVSVNAETPPYRIVKCFNSALIGPAATTPPCGINFTEFSFGYWSFDFGFRVDDRFYSATLRTPPGVVGLASAISAEDFGTTKVLVRTTDSDSNGRAARFNLIVF